MTRTKLIPAGHPYPKSSLFECMRGRYCSQIWGWLASSQVFRVSFRERAVCEHGWSKFAANMCAQANYTDDWVRCGHASQCTKTTTVPPSQTRECGAAATSDELATLRNCGDPLRSKCSTCRVDVPTDRVCKAMARSLPGSLLRLEVGTRVVQYGVLQLYYNLHLAPRSSACPATTAPGNARSSSASSARA